MAEKTLVKVVRKWSAPEIRVWINNDEIGISMELDQFLASLADIAAERLAKNIAEAAGNPTLLFTRAQLERRIADSLEDADARAVFAAAAQEIVDEMKRGTEQVV